MKVRFIAAFTATLLLGTLAAAQEYSIRANRGLNLRAEPSVNADIAATVEAGSILQVVDHIDRWLKVDREGTVVWLADWVNYSRVEDNGEASSQTGTARQIDNCCLAGWNCTFDFDFIMGKWTYDDNDGQCFSPRQETVDGVIIEGSDLFIKGVRYAFDLIQDSSPEWYTYVTTGALKIREAFGTVGAGPLERSINLKDISTYPEDAPLSQLAADIVMRNCHTHRWLAGNGVSVPEIESLAEIADCDEVSLYDLLDIFSGWLCAQGQEWLDGDMAAYKSHRCDAPAQTPAIVSPQPTSSAAGHVDNCCLIGWHCINDQEWNNGFHAYQNDDCVGSPRIPSGASCCQMGWHCTFPSDWIMGAWFIREGLQCGMPAQVNYAGVIIEGSEYFIAQVAEALDLLKSKAPEWYAYVITGRLRYENTWPRTRSKGHSIWRIVMLPKTWSLGPAPFCMKAAIYKDGVSDCSDMKLTYNSVQRKIYAS